MYNNKVICILKDTSGNTVGAEVELNGKTYKLRTNDLKSRKFNFINATVDKNGHVRAKSGSLPKTKYTAPSNVSTPDIQVKICEKSLYEDRLYKCLQIEVGAYTNRITTILIEDMASGFKSSQR